MGDQDGAGEIIEELLQTQDLTDVYDTVMVSVLQKCSADVPDVA